MLIVQPGRGEVPLAGASVALAAALLTASAVAFTVETFGGADPALRKAIGAAAERVGAAQGLAATVDYGRVFAQKGQKLEIAPEDA